MNSMININSMNNMNIMNNMNNMNIMNSMNNMNIMNNMNSMNNMNIMNNMNNMNIMNSMNNMNIMNNMNSMNNTNIMNSMNNMTISNNMYNIYNTNYMNFKDIMKSQDNINTIYNMSCLNNFYFNNKVNSSFFEKNSIYFLISYEKNIKKEEINVIDYKYERIQIAETEKEGKNYIVECIKIKALLDKYTIKLEVGKKSYDLFIRYKKNFFFDLIFIEQTIKKEVKLNCFNIYEEFYIYCKLISQNDIKKLLISSTLDIFEKRQKNSSLSFFLIILLYSLKNNIKIINNIEKLLLNIQEKGDLTKINGQNLISQLKMYEKGSPFYDALLIYSIFEKSNLLKEIEKSIIFEILGKYRNLFSYSSKLFPDYSFLIKLSKSLNDLKIILKHSFGLSDLIYLLNENKEYIMENLIDNKPLALTDFIDEKTFSEPFEQNIYLALNDIKKYEKKINKKIFKSNYNELITILKNKDDVTSQLRIILFAHQRKVFLDKEIIYHILWEKNLKKLNDIELILVIDILLNNENKHSNTFKYFIQYINEIKFENIDENFKLFFSKIIKWDIECYKLILLNIKKSQLILEFILFLIDKLSENLKGDEFIKEFNSLNLEIEKQALEFINNNKNVSNNYEMTKNILDYIFRISININYFQRIYKLIYISKDLYSIFLKILDKYIICDNEFFIEEDSFNIKLLYNLSNFNFFKRNNSFYAVSTKNKLKKILNRIINVDFSYNDIKALIINDKILKISFKLLNEKIININNNKNISSNEINKIKKKINFLFQINKIYESYQKIKLKIIEKCYGKKDKINKIKNSTYMKMINSFLLLLDINPDTIFNNEVNDLINMIENKAPIKIINFFFKKIEALDFLLSITSQDCRNLRELAGEVHGGNNQNFLSIEELLFFEKIVESFENIKKEVNNDKEFISYLSIHLEEEELKKYLEKYQQFKEFFSENLDKNKFTSEIIQKILNNSEFMIINSNKNNFKAYYKNIGEELELDKDIYKEFDYDYMIYLRDRALTRYKINDNFLSENKNKNFNFTENFQKEEKIIFENNQIFIKYVHQINELLKLLNKIAQRGYFYYFEDEENNANKKNEDIASYFNKIEKINDISLLKIKIKIENVDELSYKIHYFLNGKENGSYSDTYGIINNIYENIINIQRNAYMKKNYINFIYGKQFHLFFDYFYNKKINENLNCFLNYFTNCENLNLKSLENPNKQLHLEADTNSEFYLNFINLCEQFLHKLCIDKGLSLENIYQQNKIKKDFEKMKGIYFNGCMNLENEIIQWYKYFTNNMPLAKTLLLCKQDTTIEELLSFLYRAIRCKYHILFCLARTNYLSGEKKNFILDTISELLGEETEENRSDKMNSFLIIMNNNSKDELFQSLFRLKYIKPLDIQIDKINTIKILENNDDIKTMLIYSDHSGVGKSTYIKNKAKGEYIYFPLGGNFTKENTLKRLQYLNNNYKINQKENLLIHIDLFDTEDNSLMNDFLYFILITKLYGQDDNIFYLSKKIILFLEIPNSFINFFDKYPILRLFPKKKLSLENLEPLIVPEDICSNIKIVSLYLKLLEEENILPEKTSKYFKANNKIDKNEIVFPFTPPDIILKDENNYDYNKIVIKAEEENKNLTQKVCQNLIMKEIKKSIEKPTYYQITTFINVLASQLIQFNRNYFLSACTILDTGNVKNCSVRSLIIRKFIDLTKYFTKGAFTELLNEQESVQTLMNNKFNEKEKIEKANNILENHKHDSISFEKMDLALIFFHGGNNSVFFSIITNKEPYDSTYKDLLNLKNFQSGKNITKRIKTDKHINLDEAELLTDYRKYSQKEFLEELKSILDIDNPVEITNNENLEKKDRKISLMEMTNNYVITVDNFIKMCLILIRIRANVPIIMMGETGCGKTSLIRKLSELQNNGECLLVIDNIHAGHTNEDIIKFLEEKVISQAENLAKQEAEKKIYIVLKVLYMKKGNYGYFLMN